MEKKIEWPTEPFEVYDEEVKNMVLSMTDRERLEFIVDIVIDYDGYRTAMGLAGLLNEVYAVAKSPKKRDDIVL